MASALERRVERLENAGRDRLEPIIIFAAGRAGADRKRAEYADAIAAGDRPVLIVTWDLP